MEGKLIISIVLAIPIVILFFRTSRLKSRINELELSIVNQKAEKELKSKIKEDIKESEVHTKKEEISPFKENLISFLNWLKTDWIMKLGALLILLAISWFVRYAFLNNWIGEVGRVALGLLTGTIVVGAGYLIMNKKPIPAQIMVVLGAGILLLTTWAARNLYELFDPFTALGLMALVILTISIISIVNKSKSLAVLSLLTAAFVPVLADSTDNYLLLTIYLLLVNIGSFITVSLRGWRTLPLLSLIITAVYVIEPGIFDRLDDQTAWGFMAAFYVLFLVGSSVTMLVSQKVKYADFIITVLITLFSIALVGAYIPEHMQSVVMAGVTLFSVVVSFIAYKIGAPKKIIYLQSSAAIVLLGAATVFEFQADTLTIIFSLEILAVCLLSTFVMKDKKATSLISYLHFVPAVMALEDFNSYVWNQGVIINSHFFVLLIASVSAGITALLIKHLANIKPAKEHDLAYYTQIILSSLGLALLFALIWKVMEAGWVEETYAHGAALVVYTIVAIAFYFLGIQKEKFTYRLAGMVIIGLTVLRLLFVEIWDMTLGGRTITFVVIGILFMLTAFMEKKYLKK
ncbi:DUF2339 domain-containing protein [Candidatus Peregrinibacteria bacterium]|nr:DUF2339 domain-containing protein [Candidatus Peregrinibacteria bacterium]